MHNVATRYLIFVIHGSAKWLSFRETSISGSHTYLGNGTFALFGSVWSTQWQLNMLYLNHFVLLQRFRQSPEILHLRPL